jgi:hypothetical protein
MAAKIETTIGTAESLAASDGAFNAYDLEIQFETDVEEREAQGNFGRLAGVSGARAATIKFKVDLAMVGGTALPAWSSTLFPACGCEVSSLVIYPKSEGLSSSSSVHKSITIGFYENGMFKSAAGCMGNFKIVCTSGALTYLEFEFKGVFQTVSDAALIDPTYPLDLPMRFASDGTATTWNSYNLCMSSLEFDLGNEVILRECPDSIEGYKSAIVVDRYPKLTLDPEADLVANQDVFGDLMNNTEAAFSSVVGTGFLTGAQTTLPTCTLAAPKAQVFSLSEGDREKLLINEIEMMCNKDGNTEDREFSLTFTAAS